ncbi:hypothetical protein H4R34_002332 [Dimargaris verticillata]|uniref:Uncharacterized protein n=1 Tax=Dimargaris verticillata TaxID=2761393 RepID=A0A9W8B2Y9_9FUNG|nr:hypothetical protein H4R34_002332 [Dimargaris verticillata]
MTFTTVVKLLDQYDITELWPWLFVKAAVLPAEQTTLCLDQALEHCCALIGETSSGHSDGLTALDSWADLIQRTYRLLENRNALDTDDSVIRLLQIVEGACLAFPQLKILFTEPVRFQRVTLWITSSNEAIALQALQTLNSLVVGFPPNLRLFERDDVLFPLHRLLFSPRQRPSLRMKCIESLCLYLLPEPPSDPVLMTGTNLHPWVLKYHSAPTKLSPEKHAILAKVFGTRFVQKLSQSLVGGSALASE